MITFDADRESGLVVTTRWLIWSVQRQARIGDVARAGGGLEFDPSVPAEVHLKRETPIGIVCPRETPMKCSADREHATDSATGAGGDVASDAGLRNFTA